MAANQPRRTKYRKLQRGKFGGIATRGCEVSFGSFGIKATTQCHITARQIEAVRRVLSRELKSGKIWIRIFPHTPVTKIADQASMGSGKGSVQHYVAAIRPGTMLFEMEGIDEVAARALVKKAACKLPCLVKFAIKR
jgi:large subunit ribosomal protein L16